MLCSTWGLFKGSRGMRSFLAQHLGLGSRLLLRQSLTRRGPQASASAGPRRLRGMAQPVSGDGERRGCAAPLDSGGASGALLSGRIESTDEPIIYQMARIIEGSKDVLSLGQGVVHWLPPASALEAAKRAVDNPKCSGYGIDDGIPELRAVLEEKIRGENGLQNSSIMVTAGANQAFVNVVMALCDPDDTVVLFLPYYFNHLMAFQMSGVTSILHGRRDPSSLHPDVDWLGDALSGKLGTAIPKVVVITNPDNPTGTYVPLEDLQEISRLCHAAGCWLVLDNTYEYFMYGGRQHHCLEGPHIVNIFSFSKAYGMMGWRVGYIAYPNAMRGLGGALVKAQDTIPICANLIGQHAAVAAAREGRRWVMDRVGQLDANLALARDALSPLGEDAVKGGEGAIYLWATLPPEFRDDRAVVQWLVKRHGVIVIPGSASGVPGAFRVSFANLPCDAYEAAAARLKAGLQELVSRAKLDS